MPHLFWKQIGETPLEALNRFRIDTNTPPNVTLSYAGRLDPMADGYLLILQGKEENQNRRLFERWHKTYVVTFLLGFATDSYDILGLVTAQNDYHLSNAMARLASTLASLPEHIDLPLPPYASYRINGKPLLYYSYHNLLHTITIPTRTMQFTNKKILSINLINKQYILQSIEDRISRVKGNFRQKQTTNLWIKSIQNEAQSHVLTATVKLDASPGSYIRSLAPYLGSLLGVPLTTYRLTRTQLRSFSASKDDAKE